MPGMSSEGIFPEDSQTAENRAGRTTGDSVASSTGSVELSSPKGFAATAAETVDCLKDFQRTRSSHRIVCAWIMTSLY